jgi:hypothetical protein
MAKFVPDQKVTEKYLASIERRATALLNKMEGKPITGMRTQYTRLELREAEMLAIRQLLESRHGSCARLAFDLINIVASVDTDWVKFFPAFEELDRMVTREGFQLVGDSAGWRLLDSQGRVDQAAPTLRELLVCHVAPPDDPAAGCNGCGEASTPLGGWFSGL